MTSRKVDYLTPEMQLKAKEFEDAMKAANLPFIFTCTRRTEDEQKALYQIGRRGIPGERCVTWTLKSKHIDGRAFDIAMVKDGKVSWDTKVSVNDNEIPDYEEAGRIGESVGLVWGGRWKNKPDYPHFEIKEIA